MKNLSKTGKATQTLDAVPPELRQKVIDAAKPVLATFSIIDKSRVADTAYSEFMKASVGGTNAAATAIVRDCIDQLRRHPRFQGNRKAQFLARQNSVVSSINEYRKRLIYPPLGEPQYFNLRDMTPERRKTYGDISNEDLFDLWEAAGDKVYSDTWPLFTSLHNKFRLAITHCGHEHTADTTAWALTGTTALELAVEVWQTAINAIHRATARLPREAVEDVYRPFSLAPVLGRWKRACNNLIPDDENGTFSPLDTRNINLTIEQIREYWRSMDAKLGAAIEAADEYDELFRTRDERKKLTRHLGEMQQAAADAQESQDSLK